MEFVDLMLPTCPWSRLIIEVFLPDGEIQERRVVLERGRKTGFVGNEHDDEFRRIVELLPIGLPAQFYDPGLDRLPMAHEEPLPRIGVGFRHGRQVGLHRHLGVDGNDTAPGKAHHHVRTALFSGRLLVKIDMLGHSSHLDDAPELQFAPLSPGRR